MKYAIYGAGSLGTILGAYISKKGIEIDLINRNKKHIDALKANGAKIVGKVNFTQKVRALYTEEMVDKYDIIFLLTKQQNNKEVANLLKDHLTKTGVVVTLQNGLPEILLESILGENKVLGCTVAWGATLKEPGVSELTSEPDALTFSLGSIHKDFDQNKIEEVKKLLETMGEVELNPNFLGVRWSKLLVNSAFSGMSAVLGCTFGDVVKNKKARKCAQALIKECIDVCHANNIVIEPIQGKDASKLFNYKTKFKKWIGFMLLPIAMKKHYSLKASMLQDLEKGKKCEIEAINGVIIDCGKKANVKTPFNEMVVDIINKIENNKLTYTMDNMKFFNELIK